MLRQADTGIKYFDIEEGKGAVATKGESVMVVFYAILFRWFLSCDVIFF